MNRALALLLFWSLGVGLSAAREAPPLAADPQLEERVKILGQDLRCLVCQNQSLSDSNAPLAEDLREVIREQLRLGKDDEAVRRFLVERYGDFVLYKPPLKASTVLLWAGPFAFLAVGLVVMINLQRRRSRAEGEMPLPDEASQQKARQLLRDDQDKP